MHTLASPPLNLSVYLLSSSSSSAFIVTGFKKNIQKHLGSPKIFLEFTFVSLRKKIETKIAEKTCINNK